MSTNDFSKIDEFINNVNRIKTRKEQTRLITELNDNLAEFAISNNSPELLEKIFKPERDFLCNTIHKVSQQFINSRDSRWWDEVFSLCGKLDRKSYQSRILSEISLNLIKEGIDTNDITLLNTGKELIYKIPIRKYRSIILEKIVPILVDYGRAENNIGILEDIHTILDDISNISTSAQLRGDLAHTMSSIGMQLKDQKVVKNGITIASEIVQKNLRKATFTSIIQDAWSSPLKNDILSVPGFNNLILQLSDEIKPELLEIFIEQLFEQSLNKKTIYRILLDIDEQFPGITDIIIPALLNKAKISGERWYLERAHEFNTQIDMGKRIPIDDFIEATITVVKKSGDTRLLTDILPAIEKITPESKKIRLYHMIAETMATINKFNDAVTIINRIIRIVDKTEDALLETCIYLVKKGVLRDETTLIKDNILSPIDINTSNNIIKMAVLEISNSLPFEKILKHRLSLLEIIGLHQHSDNLIMECLNILIKRGFTNYFDSAPMISLAGQMNKQSMRDEAITLIVREVARTGIIDNNRELLRRATGFTCGIQDQNARAVSMGDIIDQATGLAIQNNDLDLLKGLNILSASLLEKNYSINATKKVVQGMVVYGTELISMEALNEANNIVRHITNSSVRLKLINQLIEGYIHVGCLMIADPQYKMMSIEQLIEPFEMAYSLLKSNTEEELNHFAITAYLDIILEYVNKKSTLIYCIPLIMFTLEITDNYERDAMFQRIMASFTKQLEHIDATDNFAALSIVLEDLDINHESGRILDLIYRMLINTEDLYIKYPMMYRIAEAYIKNDDYVNAGMVIHLLDDITKEISTIDDKIIMLAELAALSASVNESISREFLQKSLNQLALVEPERLSYVRKHIVYALSSIHVITQNDADLNLAINIAEKIEEPTDYIGALAAIFNMVDDSSKRKDLFSTMCYTISCIPFMDLRLSLLQEISRLIEKYGEDVDIVLLLQGINSIVGTIHIPFISALIQQWIVRMLLVLYEKNNNEVLLKRAQTVVSNIHDNRLRGNLIEDTGMEEDTHARDIIYDQLLELERKIKAGTSYKNNLSELIGSIQSKSDRTMKVQYYTDLYLTGNNTGEEKIAKQALELALKEANIIRPLSRRAYILADIACRVSYYNKTDLSSEILEMATNSALSIREESVRNEVYNEVEISMKILEEQWI